MCNSKSAINGLIPAARIFMKYPCTIVNFPFSRGASRRDCPFPIFLRRFAPRLSIPHFPRGTSRRDCPFPIFSAVLRTAIVHFRFSAALRAAIVHFRFPTGDLVTILVGCQSLSLINWKLRSRHLKIAFWSALTTQYCVLECFNHPIFNQVNRFGDPAHLKI